MEFEWKPYPPLLLNGAWLGQDVIKEAFLGGRHHSDAAGMWEEVMGLTRWCHKVCSESEYMALSPSDRHSIIWPHLFWMVHRENHTLEHGEPCIVKVHVRGPEQTIYNVRLMVGEEGPPGEEMDQGTLVSTCRRMYQGCTCRPTVLENLASMCKHGAAALMQLHMMVSSQQQPATRGGVVSFDEDDHVTSR